MVINNKNRERRIIDKRRKEKYILDDEYLNGQAKLCGWKGTIVYNSLCRHANIDQECFPSIKMMMEQHNVSRNTILKGIENLEKRKVIEIKKSRSKKGQWLNNTYILLDKSEWIYDQVPVRDTAIQVPVELPPSPSQGLDQVPVRDTKETHMQGNTYKETHILCEQGSREETQVNEVIKMFEIVNPSYEKMYPNKTQRSAAARLLKKWTLKQIQTVVSILPKLNADQYAKGKSITPLQLEDNLGYIKAFIYKTRNNSIRKA